MPVQIILNQTGNATAGIAGDAREDFVTGVPVQATLAGGPYGDYLWTLQDKPLDFIGGANSAAGPTSPKSAATTIQPIDNEGTYLLQVMVDSGQGLGATPDDITTITFYAGTALSALADQLPQRQPAFGERLEHNVLDALFGSGRNPRGWAQTWGRWFEVIKAAFKGSSRTWARVLLTGTTPSIVMMNNVASVTRVSQGIYTANFIRPQTSVNYGVSGNARGGVGGSVTGYGEGLNSVTIARADPFGALVDADFTFGVLST